MSGDISYWRTSVDLPKKGETVWRGGKRFRVLTWPDESSADFSGFRRFHDDPKFVLGIEEGDAMGFQQRNKPRR